MKELEYPFDSKFILRKRKALKRELLSDGSKRLKKHIAVLGGSTTNDVVDMLELFLLNYGIEPSFYQSEYGKYWEDALFKNPELDKFKPDVIYVHTTNRNISQWPSIMESSDDVDSMLSEQFEHFESMWISLREKYQCPVIQNNFEMPETRMVGNIAFSAKWGGY